MKAVDFFGGGGHIVSSTAAKKIKYVEAPLRINILLHMHLWMCGQYGKHYTQQQ